jgi:hypothetical protein
MYSRSYQHKSNTQSAKLSFSPKGIERVDTMGWASNGGGHGNKGTSNGGF